MLTTEQVRKLIEDKKVTIGTQSTMVALRNGELKSVVMASNTAADTRSRIERLQALTGVATDDLAVTNTTLGTMCKKPFAISVLGIRA